MIRALSCALLSLALVGGHAETSQLDPFRPLVGGTWVGSGFLPGVGNYATTREFAWTLDGKFIRTHHEITIRDTTRVEAGMLGWDAQRGTISLWSFSSDGSHSVATQVSTKGGGIVLDGTTVGSEPLHWRVMIRMRGADELSIITEHERKGSWIPYTSAIYRRRK